MFWGRSLSPSVAVTCKFEEICQHGGNGLNRGRMMKRRATDNASTYCCVFVVATSERDLLGSFIQKKLRLMMLFPEEHFFY